MYRPGEIFDLVEGDKPKSWMVVVPDDTDPDRPLPIRTEFDPNTRTRRHFIDTKPASVEREPQSVPEAERRAAKIDAKVLRAKSADALA